MKRLLARVFDAPFMNSSILTMLLWLFSILSVSLSLGCIEIPKTTAADPTVSYTDINGYKFHTEVYGNKNLPTVVVVHGGPGADFAYLHPLSGLSGEYRVVFYDQRGAGLSPREPAEEYNIDLFLRDLDDIVNIYSENSPVRLIGHSWGGMLVTAYLAQHPEKVSHAVIAEPGMLNKNAAKAYIESLSRNSSSLDKLKLVRYLATSVFVKSEDGYERKDYVMTRLLSSAKGKPYLCDGEGLPPGSIRRAGFSSFERMTMPLMKNPEMFNYDLAKGIERYKGRLLLLSSNCSFVGSAFQEEYHVPLLPMSLEHAKVENTGHYMITNKSEESLKIIRLFFKK